MGYRNRSYSRDPYQTTARFNSICAGCGKQIKKGESIYIWPGKKVFCQCGEGEFRQFLSSIADEAVYNGTGNPW
uniref:FLZ-type domain-containing protein n=1 Tax=viral metagenome TaxID=1070528 RepID=A0A6M3LRE1_9ZZZZ